MREIKASLITEKVRNLCIKCNVELPPDVADCIRCRMKEEDWEPAKEILQHIVENFELSSEIGKPICQDTGMTCVFVEIGQDVHVDGNLEEAIQEGVRQGYRDGFLRKSVVADPLNRVNTGDNTPAVINYEIVPGDKLIIHIAPKGFGSENMSKIAMLRPSDGVEGVKRFVLDTVEAAGPNPCPPIIVGVGIGGTFERAALMAKKALLRPLNESREVPNEQLDDLKRATEEQQLNSQVAVPTQVGATYTFYRDLEKELLDEINKLGIGPQGFGGKTTALAVNIETFPTHIAGLPVAVNIGCHVTRHGREVL